MVGSSRPTTMTSKAPEVARNGPPVPSRAPDRVAALPKPVLDSGGGLILVLSKQDARTSLGRPAQPHSSSDLMSGMSA